MLQTDEPFVSKVRRGMQMGLTNEETARSLGLYEKSYRLGRKLLLLRERDVLSHDELVIADRGLDMLSNGHTAIAFRLVRDLVSKHWKRGYRGRPNRDEFRQRAKDRKRFDSTLFVIRQACTDKDDMEIPDLNAAESQQVLELLQDSIGALCVLYNKVKGDDQ